MTIEELKLYLPDYLKERGIPLNKPFTCLNPEHKDNNPSMSFDKKRNIIHCFSCGKTYTLIDLVMQDENLSLKDAIAYLNNKYGGEPLPSGYKKEEISQIPSYEAKLSTYDNLSAITYFEAERGFKHAKNTILLARVKSNDDFIIFPHYHFISLGGEDKKHYTITDYQARRFIGNDKKNRYTRKGKTSLYDALAVLDSDLYNKVNVIINEGEVDSLSILDIKQDEDTREQLKNLFSIALSGVANTNLLEQALLNIPENRRGEYHFLIALDNDKSGEETTRKVEEILETLKYPYSTYPVLKSGDKIYHDINEMMQEDRQTLKDNLVKYMSEFSSLESKEKSLIEKKREAYFNKYTSKTHLNALLSDFTNKVDNLSINTNFELLNALFNGVSRGVITLGALSSLGKTTLLLQIADQLASNNDKDILYFSLEQSGKELVSKSLSRLTFLNALKTGDRTNKAKYSSSILTTKLDSDNQFIGYDATEKILLNSALFQYESISNRLFIIEPKNSISLSISDIEEIIKEHIAITGNKPIVFIDYLQIIAPENPHLSDKQAVDINISNLRRICSVYDLLVFAISSVGRANYYTSIDINSFKESGAIEYGSDILLGINFTAIEEEANSKAEAKGDTNTIKKMIKEEKSKSPRNVFIEVLKNRNGKSGDKFYFHYYPEFNTFIELTMKEGAENRHPLLNCLEKLNEREEDLLPF